MNYKKIIPNQNMRFKILGLLDVVPDKIMIHIQYFIKTGRKLNLNNPIRFTEKIQWYKLNYRDPLMTRCADKYSVRGYINEKGLKKILVPLYGSYNDAKEIDFNKLPDKFVLKTTNGSHTNIICKNKDKLDIDKTINTLNRWLNKRTVKLGREWAYYDIKPKIIAEMLLEEKSEVEEDIKDYKFVCFNGEVEYVWVDFDRFTNHKRNFYDVDWNYLNLESDVGNLGDILPKPEGYAEMLTIAKKLASDFPHVRVDLYLVNNQVYFGEMTFYLLSGYENFKPDSFDHVMGSKFILPH